MRRRIWSGMVAMWLLSGALAHPATFWKSTFEDDQGTLRGSGWGTDSCTWLQPGGSPWLEGCNPVRTTTRPFAGLKSLDKDYTGPVLSQDGNHGAYVTRPFPVSSEVWISFRLRNENFKYSNPGQDKVHYIMRDLNAGNEGVNFVLDFHYGNRLVMIAQSDSDTTPPCSGNTNPGWYNTCIYEPNLAEYAFPQNQWVCVEEHYKSNSLVGGVPQSDGIIEVFFTPSGGSTIQTIGYYNRRWNGVGQVYQPNLGAIRIYTQSGGGHQFIDDFAVGNTRQGCEGGGGPVTPPDTTPPVTPAELRVTELLQTSLDQLANGFSAAMSFLKQEAESVMQVLVSWLGPSEAVAEIANDHVTVSWGSPQDEQLTLNLTLSHYADGGAPIKISTIPSLAGSYVHAFTPPLTCHEGQNCWICADAQTVDARGVVSKWVSEVNPSGKVCGQIAQTIVLPPPVEIFTHVQNANGVLSFEYDPAVCRTSPYVAKSTKTIKGSTRKTVTLRCVR